MPNSVEVKKDSQRREVQYKCPECPDNWECEACVICGPNDPKPSEDKENKYDWICPVGPSSR